MPLELNEATLRQRIADKAEESETLEFKSALPARDDKGKHEFLKDVAAMANANGGTIVYGVSEQDGAADTLAPISGVSADAEILRLNQSLDASIEPRLAGVRFDQVQIAAGGFVLVVSVERSFIGPHRVTLNGKNAFYLRAQRHVAEFSYSQLREAFNLRAIAEGRAREFRAERLMRIKGEQTPRPVVAGPQYVIHMLPLVSFGQATSVDLLGLQARQQRMLPESASSFSTFTNLDGLVQISRFDERHVEEYVQVFRNGSIETVGIASTPGDSRKVLPSLILARDMRSAIATQLPILKTMGIQGPVAIGVSWLSVGDYKLAIPHQFLPPPDRDDLELPELWLDSVDTAIVDPDAAVRPLLDILWQCFNVTQCSYYDEHGRWSEN